VIGTGEDGVVNEVVHRREGLRLDISFFARHLRFADVFSGDLRAGRRRFSDAENAQESCRMERRVRNAGKCS